MQLPFDRLVQIMDRAASTLQEPVVAQIGQSSVKPDNLDFRAQIDPAQFDSLVENSRLIVSHAGVGTILLAQRLRKPVILFPRRSDRGEHRTDHQLDTARTVEGRPGVYVAWTEEDLISLLNSSLLPPPAGAEETGRDRLRQGLAQLIRGD